MSSKIKDMTEGKPAWLGAELILMTAYYIRIKKLKSKNIAVTVEC